ncbi:dihydroorotase [Ginsengibacter hankyongi]|uniref:Dihydroorotase n=1 Tax=Ginsengibacter hankyongi TaxID=2607284 RepID=A0A5J5IL47_9BACT|nr:dihydroorotase [Ginsengibacter hankyongi]KAA9041719.1 dihydroorotase [Ginsengibacter hankyongi]
MENYLLKNISIVNEGKIELKTIYLKKGRIERIDNSFNVKEKVTEINGDGKHLLPGAIDDQVHFREPGLTHKATIYTESKAAVAGGVTSFMEMPNTIPNALTEQLLEEKYAIAKATSLANYSFFMGTSNNNADEVLKMNRRKREVCGVKIFMGSSTGNMLVDNESQLNKIFGESELLIATHCEDEKIIKKNYQRLKNNKQILEPADHPIIRDENACYQSSSFAVSLAKKYNSRLHILHISTEKELALFRNDIPLKEKMITAEVCVHHLHFTADDYEPLGYLIKCNPAIKDSKNKTALWKALLDDRLDVIATDHAPHTLEEKEGPYEHAHSGLPLVQHPLLLMLEYYKKDQISLEKVVEKMSHAVAECFKIENRGYIREGYFADVVMIDLNETTTVKKEGLLYKCGWSPLEGHIFPASVIQTFVNGNCVYLNKDNYGKFEFDESIKGERLLFNR